MKPPAAIIAPPAVSISPMGATEARRCAEQIRNHLDSARALILDLCEREGWKALGYASWRACVVAEFGHSQSHLYRQLEAARIERDIDPAGEIGRIPERQLRPLAVVPPERRKPAWEAARAKAKSRGEKVAHQHTAEVAREVAPTPAQVRKDEVERFLSVCQGEDHVPEPADIAEQRRKGVIPEGVEVRVDEPWERWGVEPDGPDDDEPDGVMAEQSDGEYLADCPARASLDDRCRKDFDRDALLYRRLEPARGKFAEVARKALKANRKGGRTGHHHSAVSWFLRAESPQKWLVCGDCKGTGRHHFVGDCPTCRTMGYLTR